MTLTYVDLLHRCDLPDTSHLPNPSVERQVMARWRCPECGTRWQFSHTWPYDYRCWWKRTSRPSRRWRKAEARRLAALETA